MPVTARRFSAFATIGALGFILQIAALAFLTELARWTWLPATFVAVELAVIHNYVWHERWTWRDVRGPEKGHGRFLSRLARFHVANGLGSIAGNLALMWLFVGWAGMPAIVGNILAVGVMSAANFMIADRWVFAAPIALTLVFPAAADAAPIRPTLDAWDRYVARTEAHLERTRDGMHPAARDTLSADGESFGVPSGTISHWRGSILIHGVTLDRLLDGLLYPGTPPPQDDVLASRVLSRGDNSLRVYVRLARHAIVTVSYDTEHEMSFTRRSPTVATARSVATRIEEIGGTDHGFLWRLHSYWRYEQTREGVLVELDSLTLSRDVPSLVRAIASPLVNRVARESMCSTLDALRRYFEESART
jgi:putative flippase GtrA